jgi:RNA polymerase sigma-70 factor (ECF subfamily)
MDDIADPEAAARNALSHGDRRRTLSLLMGLYGNTVYNYCRHMVRETALAEDVLQTTFVQAFADLVRYQGKSSFRNWLLGIARHRCLDTLKMRRREEQHITRPGAAPDVEASTAGAEEQLHLASIGKYLAHCLERLHEVVREAIVLRFMQQMSYEEMARLTGERAATLQMRVARAMSGLRKCLQGKGVGP